MQGDAEHWYGIAGQASIQELRHLLVSTASDDRVCCASRTFAIGRSCVFLVSLCSLCNPRLVTVPPIKMAGALRLVRWLRQH